jgi:hypothetical protein
VAKRLLAEIAAGLLSMLAVLRYRREPVRSHGAAAAAAAIAISD